MVLPDQIVNWPVGIPSLQDLENPIGEVKHPKTVAKPRMIRPGKCQTCHSKLPNPVQPLEFRRIDQIVDKPISRADGNQAMHGIPEHAIPVV
jgi:hypothetical protein